MERVIDADKAQYRDLKKTATDLDFLDMKFVPHQLVRLTSKVPMLLEVHASRRHYLMYFKTVC